MKKLFCSLFILFSIFTSIFSNENLISFNAGLSSGLLFYGENSLPKEADNIDTNYRVIIGSLANINLNVIKQVSFYAGTDILSDFNWKDNQYSNHLHVTFPLGFKIYPGLGGFNLGLAYTLGFRTDFIRNTSTRTSNIAAWGNGFKIQMEYNFAHDSDMDYLPSVGCSWNLMPRGNYSYDNIITFYITENF